jgi:hypothetical protein
MVKGSAAFAMQLSEYVPFMQTQLGYRIAVADTVRGWFL